jgi:hypothetical protein
MKTKSGYQGPCGEEETGTGILFGMRRKFCKWVVVMVVTTM